MTLDDFLGNEKKTKGKWIPVYGFFKYYHPQKIYEDLSRNLRKRDINDVLLAGVWWTWHGIWVGGILGSALYMGNILLK